MGEYRVVLLMILCVFGYLVNQVIYFVITNCHDINYFYIYRQYRMMGGTGMPNSALSGQAHMGVSGGANMGNMQFHSPGLHAMNPNMQGANLQRQPGMMSSQGASGQEAGMGGARNSMGQLYPGMSSGMMNGGSS